MTSGDGISGTYAWVSLRVRLFLYYVKADGRADGWIGIGV